MPQFVQAAMKHINIVPVIVIAGNGMDAEWCSQLRHRVQTGLHVDVVGVRVDEVTRQQDQVRLQGVELIDGGTGCSRE